MLISLAWRNVWRQPYRTSLSLVSIVLASAITIFIFSLQQGSYGAMKESALRIMDGFAQIQPQGYADDPDLRKVIADPDSIIRRLSALHGITTVAPRASTYVIVSDGQRSFGSAALGVDPAAERLASSLVHNIQTGRYLQTSDDDAVVIGVGLARNLKLSVGDPLTLLGNARDGSVAADVLTVVGVFATGEAEVDRQVIEIPLTRFQSTFGMGDDVNALALIGARLADVQQVLPALHRLVAAEGLTVRDWTQLEPALHDAILLDMSFSSLLYVSLLVVVVFIILNTLLMSVLERTREFGTLLALGMLPGLIGRMVWLELIIQVGIGALLGIGLGVAFTSWIATRGIAFSGAEAMFAQFNMPSTLYPVVNALSVFAGPAAIVLSICVAGVIPYLRTRRLEPVSAMRAA